ncbi:MAG: FAD-dependent oxidoreductase [Acidobacteriota bacterium]
MQRSRLDATDWDVLVCGAGCAGTAAAYGAAMAGARTLLLERLGFAGGTPVAGMIHTLDAVNSCADHTQQVVGGFTSRVMEELEACGGMGTRDNPDEVISFHPEHMKVALDRVLSRAGVNLLYRAHVSDALVHEQRVTGVEAALLDGRAHFHARCVVDATGDAEVAHHAGLDWQQSEELQALTYHFRLGNVAPGETWQSLEAAMQAVMQGSGMRYGGPWVIRLTEHEVSVNATRVIGNPLDPEERSRLEMNAREDMLTIAARLQAGVPALRESYILAGATDLHVRESRKVVGVYTLTEEDIFSGREFPDTIGLGAWPIDIHPTDGFVGVHPHKDSPPHPYPIPYRCLVPKAHDGLLVAGRPISTTHRAHGSTRVPGTSLATGQAAGVAAALAARYRVSPRHIAVRELQRELLQQGAILSLDQVAR